MSENSSSAASCFLRYLLVALLPTVFIAFITLNYFKVLNISNISSEIFYITTAIYFIFLLFVPHNAYITECKIKAKLNQLTNAIDDAIDKTSVEINGIKKSVLNIREFLEEYFIDIRNDNFAKIATSTFPMLGILGTFIAIAISMPDFTVTNTKELDNSISILLSGVGTAFYASIFGIFLSLLWSFFERFGLSRIDKLANSIENIYSKYIWSKKELLKFQYEQKNLINNEFINTLKEIFNLDFIRNINKEHLESYEKIINSTKNGLAEIENSLVKISDRLSRNIKELHFANNSIEAQKSIEDNLEKFERSSKELKALLESFDAGLDNAFIQIDKELAKAVLHIEEMVKNIKELK